MADKRKVLWWEVDKRIDDLSTDHEYEIQVQREAIPLVFVPGIMGTRLRKPGTAGTGKTKGLPDLRWDPFALGWILDNRKILGKPSGRRELLVGLAGESFKPGYLEVANAKPPGDGFEGVIKPYVKEFLQPLKKHPWGALGKIFEFPVYAVGYNWTDDNKNSGQMLANRIKEIKEEAKGVTGICEKVILITHSMGGLVARWASQIVGVEGSILGIIHGVQPITGAPAAYWRMKAGFEVMKWCRIKDWGASAVLGNSGKHVTPVLANIPGGLELLPSKEFQPNKQSKTWLRVTGDAAAQISLPTKDPYEEIYKVKAVVKPTPGQKSSQNAFWGLVDPDLLDPGDVTSGTGIPLGANEAHSKMDATAGHVGGPWSQYVKWLDKAKQFHEGLGTRHHPKTYCFRGTGFKTANVIELRVEEGRSNAEPYEKRGFRGIFTDATGNSKHAVLQKPADRAGDGTVPVTSASALPCPGMAYKTEHQPAYENDEVKEYVFKAIAALCKVRFEERRSGSSLPSAGKGGKP